MTVQWQEHRLGSFRKNREMGHGIRIRCGKTANDLALHYRWMTILPCYHLSMAAHYRITRFEFIEWYIPQQEKQQNAA